MKNICFTQCGRWPPLGSAHPPGATCTASGCTRRGVHAPVAHIVRTGARSFAQGAAPGPIAVGVSPLEVLPVPSGGLTSVVVSVCLRVRRRDTLPPLFLLFEEHAAADPTDRATWQRQSLPGLARTHTPCRRRTPAGQRPQPAPWANSPLPRTGAARRASPAAAHRLFRRVGRSVCRLSSSPG